MKVDRFACSNLGNLLASGIRQKIDSVLLLPDHSGHWVLILAGAQEQTPILLAISQALELSELVIRTSVFEPRRRANNDVPPCLWTCSYPGEPHRFQAAC